MMPPGLSVYLDRHPEERERLEAARLEAARRAALTNAEDRRKGFFIIAGLLLIMAISIGMAALLTGCATIDAIHNVDK